MSAFGRSFLVALSAAAYVASGSASETAVGTSFGISKPAGVMALKLRGNQQNSSKPMLQCLGSCLGHFDQVRARAGKGGEPIVHAKVPVGQDVDPVGQGSEPVAHVEEAIGEKLSQPVGSMSSVGQVEASILQDESSVGPDDTPVVPSKDTVGHVEVMAPKLGAPGDDADTGIQPTGGAPDAAIQPTGEGSSAMDVIQQYTANHQRGITMRQILEEQAGARLGQRDAPVGEVETPVGRIAEPVGQVETPVETLVGQQEAPVGQVAQATDLKQAGALLNVYAAQHAAKLKLLRLVELDHAYALLENRSAREHGPFLRLAAAEATCTSEELQTVIEGAKRLGSEANVVKTILDDGGTLMKSYQSKFIRMQLEAEEELKNDTNKRERLQQRLERIVLESLKAITAKDINELKKGITRSEAKAQGVHELLKSDLEEALVQYSNLSALIEQATSRA